MQNLCIKFILLLTGLAICIADENLVMTPSGPIRGTVTMSVTGKKVDVFYGIPYAEPPIGKLRFGAPVAMSAPWTEELNATVLTRACYNRIPQLFRLREDMKNFFPKRPWSEDCLKLHIWVPKPRPENCTVMVYIHGGGFALGDPLVSYLSGATLAAEENIIFVSMNYRLDVQGFLYLGIPEAPGNQGLLDQQMALKWLRGNIASFGGNPDDMTIFGMSAGGASVGFQLLAPSNRNLFKRAIVMSGVPNAMWAHVQKEVALDRSLKLLQDSGCSNENMTQALECLQNVHPEEILQWNAFPFSLRSMLPIPPTIDGHFIPYSPEKTILENYAHRGEVMIGTTLTEGSGTALMVVPEIEDYPDGRVSSQAFKSAIRGLFLDEDEMTKKIFHFLYTNWTSPDDPYLLRDGLIDFLSDVAFNCASQEFADLLISSGNRVYRYVVDHTSKIFPLHKWMKTSHGMDSALHLGLAAAGNHYSTPEEVVLSKQVMRWWANFARTGDPNDSGSILWPQSTLEKREYLRIAVNANVQENFRTRECGLLFHVWKSLSQSKQNCKL